MKTETHEALHALVLALERDDEYDAFHGCMVPEDFKWSHGYGVLIKCLKHHIEAELWAGAQRILHQEYQEKLEKEL
jgi:hypothetical protein